MSAVLSSWWAVLVVFLIPFGGGIPAGVLLAKKTAIAWPVTAALYFVSDVILAFAFEPLMNGVSALGKKSAAMGRALEAMAESTRRTVALYGTNNGVVALVLIAFGVDPMTGRAAAAAAGHGFLSGWAIAITGDMMYFGVVMASTLWLNSILGDGNAAMGLVLLVMIGVPILKKKWSERHARVQPG